MTITRIGRYEIEKELGRGAMAVVYRGVDPIIGRVVAIKTIRIEASLGIEQEELRQRLYREAQSAGNLNHPNIVTIYDIGEEGDLAYIAMEFIEGQSLEAWMAGNPVPPLERTASIIEQIASGLDYAAARGIIHRDIKPGNILLTQDVRAKIADFGIAKFSTSKFTQTGMVLGTPSYMSPEQALGGNLDGRSDIFSLGVIFYEMLTGERPFHGSNATTIIYKILHTEPISARQLNVALPAGYDIIVHRMLAKDPAQRYQSCGEVIRDLRNPPSLIAPAAIPLQTGATRAGTSHRYIIAILAGLLVIVLSLLSIYLYQIVQHPRPTSVGPAVAEPKPAPPQKQVPAQAPGDAVVPKASKPITAQKEATVQERPARAQVRVEYSGTAYPAAIFDGTLKLNQLTNEPLSIHVAAGDHRFRVISEGVFLDLELGRVRLKADQVYSISLPGLGSAYLDVPNDAYTGCEILLNGRNLPTPYPAQIPQLSAGNHRIVFRWNAGKYAGKELASTFSSQENHLYRVRGDPQSDKVLVQQVR